MENNNQDIKLCPSCGAKNKAVYKYCNECGAILNQTYYTGHQSSAQNSYSGQYTKPNYGYQQSTNQQYYNGHFNQGGYTPYSPYEIYANAPYYGTPDFDGVSAKDVFEYTGRKTKLFNNLKNQHFSSKGSAFCWPLFVLGFLLNFFGMGCWFLYHKMYKPAVALFSVSAINLVITCLNVLSLNSISDQQIIGLLESNSTSYYYNSNILGPTYTISSAISSFLGMVSFGVTIFLSFFAYKWYKNHLLNKIREEYAKSPMPNLFMAGKPKGGLVAVASVIYGIIFFVSVFLCALPFVIRTFNVTKEYLEDKYYNSIPYYYYDDYYGDNNDGYGGFTDPFANETPKGEYW